MKKIEDILAQCIEDVKEGKCNVEDCLSRYPSISKELEPLLQLALNIQQSPDVKPSTAFKVKARVQLMEQINERERIPERIDTEEWPVAASWGPLRTGLKVMKDAVAGIMFLRLPLWKTALASVLAVALIAGLLTTLPTRANLSDEALAIEIALNSSMALEAAGGEEISEITEVSIVYIEDNIARVDIFGPSLSTLALHTTFHSWEVSLKVDLFAEEITHYHYRRDNVTDEETEQILSILKADPRTKALLDQGAVISYTGYFRGVTGWGNARWNEETGESEMIEEKHLSVDLDLGDELYVARVDLIRGEVSAFGSPMFSLMTDEEIEKILNILEADPRTRALLDEGAVIRGMSKYMVSSTVVKEGEGPAELTAARVMVHIELGDKQYGADVDLIRGEVSAFGENLEYIRPQSP